MPSILSDNSFELLLDQHTSAGELVERLPDQKVRCVACGHRCLIPAGQRGVCKVRFNRDGELRIPYGYVSSLNCDPIEKKPFFHVLPGSTALSFGMLGCDYHCAYCQNWQISQAVRDPRAEGTIRAISAEEMAAVAVRRGARILTSTYNEPLITSEWAVAVFKQAKKHHLLTAYVSNGNGTPEVIEYLRPYLDCYKVDLKGFQDKNYRKLGGTLKAVTDTIQTLVEKNIWVEIVTLVVPDWNDSEAELRDIAQFIVSVNPSIPWHLTAFHEDYKMFGMGNTRVSTLLKAGEIGKAAGLHFVYLGNLPGRVSEWENTYCPQCRSLLVERFGFTVQQMNIRDGACRACGNPIPGVWS